MLFNQAVNLGDNLQRSVLSITLMGEKTRYSLRVKKEDLSAFKKVSGMKLPTKIGKSVITKKQTNLCLGPNEWMVITDTKLGIQLRANLEKLASKFTYSYVDVSHRNVAFVISGQEAVKAVNVGCPLDLSLEKFPIGKVTRTVFENASIILMRTGEAEFHLECWRSFAPYICGFFDRFVTDI